MTELKPCPFCGSGWLYEISRNDYYDYTPAMFCNSCKAVVTWEQVEEEGVNDKTRAFVCEQWNSRAERTCHVNELDALTQTLSMANGCSWGECSECGCLTPIGSMFCVECGARVVSE